MFQRSSGTLVLACCSLVATRTSGSAGFPSLLLQKVSGVLPFLIDYDDAASVVILTNGGTVVACANLIPPPPDFPT